MSYVARVVAVFVLSFAVACGSGDSNGVQPTPAPTATPRPTPGCGNGIIDPGEFCDGQDFCAACQVSFRGCCEVGDPAVESVCGAQSLSPQACVTTGGRFSVGTSCRGSDCNEGACFGDGRCESDPIAPVSLCCELPVGGCHDEVVSSTGALGGFIFDCQVSADGGTATLGSCAPSGACEAPGGG